jgi:hypothetical protein
VNEFESELSRRVNAAIDEQLGVRRPAPPFDPSHAEARRPHPLRTTRWLPPLAAAAVIAVIAAGSALVASGALSQKHAVPPATTPAPVPVTTSGVPTPSAHLSHTTPPPSAVTQVDVWRPVTRSGDVVAGWTVTADSGATVTCGQGGVWSGLSVDPGVVTCGKESHLYYACWPKAGDALRAYCMQSPFSHNLLEIRLSTKFPTGLSTPSRPVPYGVVLADRTQCDRAVFSGIQAGPAPLVEHPGWSPAYLCGFDFGYALWSPSNNPFDETAPRWTAQYASSSGRSPVRTVQVATAYYVGFAS